MTAPARMRWRDVAVGGAVCLLVAAGGAVVWFRAAYHFWPGLIPSRVHWCGRDYEADGLPETWAQITSAVAPRPVTAFGTYPPVLGFGRPLLADAAPGVRPSHPGEPCAMAVFLRTSPGRYQWYTLEGGP